MKEVWSDAFVEEGNLTHHVFTLRKILGEGHDLEYIETIPRRGYRFVSPVREVRDESMELAENQTGLVTLSADKATASTAARIENLNRRYNGLQERRSSHNNAAGLHPGRSLCIQIF
jgi:DNA-binding winged helix-turn-helix (wHTH) protein